MLKEKRIKRAIKNKVKVTMAQEDLVRLTLQFLILKAQTHQASAIDKQPPPTTTVLNLPAIITLTYKKINSIESLI